MVMKEMKMTTDMPLDQVILVDQNDQPIGEMDKVEAHRGDAQRHRAISVFLFNAKGELLIQQRSQQKIVGAGQWVNTCCGNVRPGESYQDCAYRRLREELGIKNVTLRELHKFEYHTKCNDEFSEWEIDTIFVGDYNEEVHPNPEEVAAVAWKDVSTLLVEVDTDQQNALTHRTYAPWLPLLIEQRPVLELLTEKKNKHI